MKLAHLICFAVLMLGLAMWAAASLGEFFVPLLVGL